MLRVEVKTPGKGLHDVTALVRQKVKQSGVEEGLCTLYIRHTSASLLIQENYDPSARRDLEAWFERLVPEGDAIYTHTIEGPDDMPAHIKAALTASSLSIPVEYGELMLGTWQGIFLWEHRRQHHDREILIHVSR